MPKIVKISVSKARAQRPAPTTLESKKPPFPGYKTKDLGMPENPEDLGLPGRGDMGSFTGPGDIESPKIDPALAGRILNVPFKLAHAARPEINPLDEKELDLLADDFSFILSKYGFAKIARREIVFAFNLSTVILARAAAVKKVQEEKKKNAASKKRTDNDSRSCGGGKDDFSEVLDKEPPAAPNLRS